MTICEVEQCVGCGACYSICPKNRIVMKPNSEGFIYPKIDTKSCIKCHICKEKCPVLNYDTSDNFYKIVYASYAKNKNIRMKSSSGGIFTELAQLILSKNGVVFGAAFSDDFMSVKHIAIDNINDLQKLRGSKYVQSDIGDTYKEAKKYLNENKLVLFTGTPCQIAGLKSFLQKSYDNLITQDLICHGVPSPLVWKKYVEYQKDKNKSDIKMISFRNKESGWKTYSVLFKFKSNFEYVQPFYNDIYMQGFLKNYYLRKSCYNCKFKNGNGNSDITIADFWGIENEFPEMDDDKGTSLVIINSNKGKKFFDGIIPKLILKQTTIENVGKHNSMYVTSVKRPKIREKVLKNIKKYGLNKGIAKSLKPTLRSRIKGKIIYLLNKLR